MFNTVVVTSYANDLSLMTMRGSEDNSLDAHTTRAQPGRWASVLPKPAHKTASGTSVLLR